MNWKFLNYRRIGANHAAAGEICEDFSAVAELDESLLIAVADGAGSASHGDIGAYLAVNAAVRSWRDNRCPTNRGGERLRQAAIAARYALTDESKSSGLDLESYATTLLLIHLDRDALYGLQVGDGGMVCERRSELQLLLVPQHGGATNTTRFLTDNDWWETNQRVHLAHSVDAVAVFSDGIESQVVANGREPFGQFFIPVFDALRSLSATETGMLLDHHFGSELLARCSGDDITFVMACGANNDE